MVLNRLSSIRGLTVIFGLPFRLDPGARARPGTGIIVGGDASIRLLREHPVPLYLGAYGRMVRYPDHDFDDSYVGGEAGPEFHLPGGRLRTTATGFERWYGHKRLVTSVGGRLGYDKVIGAKWSLETSLSVRHNGYAHRSDVDGWDVEGAVSANRALDSSTLGFAYASIQRIAGFAPSVRLTWSRNHSTISLYDQKRLRAEFGIAKAF